MAHRVDMTMPKGSVMNADVEFHAHHVEDGSSEVIGKLKVSKGGIEWVPKHRQKGVQLDWKEFARLMERAD